MLQSRTAVAVLSALIQFAGSAVVVGQALKALLYLLKRQGSIESARLTVLDGALSALSCTLAATLLRLLSLQAWNEIGSFVAILIVRIGIKNVLQRERRQILDSAGASSSAPIV